MVGDYRSWNDHGNIFCDPLPSWINYHSIPHGFATGSSKATLFHSIIHVCCGYSSNNIRNICIGWDAVLLLSYFLFFQTYLTRRPSFWRYYCRIDFCPSWIWVLSPSPLCKRPSINTSMVYTHASVAWSIHYSGRFSELWKWTCSCLCRSGLCNSLGGNLWTISGCLYGCFTDGISVSNWECRKTEWGCI